MLVYYVIMIIIPHYKALFPYITNLNKYIIKI